MQKECNGRYGLNLNTEERKAMYDLISTMIEKDIRGESTENIETQYNIFRLAKHVIRSDKDIMDHYWEYINRYLRTVLNPYGNTRLEWWRFVDNLRMEISCSTSPGMFNKNTPEQIEENKKQIYPALANVFMYLQEMEAEYQHIHMKILDAKDVYRWKKFIPAWDTKDPLLKSVRKGMEAWDVGHFDEIMDYCWYTAMYEPERPRFCWWRYISKKMIQPHIINKDIIQERIRLEKAFDIFISTHKINLDFETVKQKIYNSNQDVRPANREYINFRMNLFDKHDIDPSQNLLDLINAFRNFFPHQALQGRCPEEVFGNL